MITLDKLIIRVTGKSTYEVEYSQEGQANQNYHDRKDGITQWQVQYNG